MKGEQGTDYAPPVNQNTGLVHRAHQPTQTACMAGNAGYVQRGSLDAMSGNYAVLGDGRVAWRSRSTWDLAKMVAARENGWKTHYIGPVE